MNIRRRLYLSIGVFICSLAYLATVALQVTEKDMQRYEALIFRTEPFNFNQSSGKVISTQKREKVNKEILLAQKEGFKKVVIDATSSELLILHKENKKSSMVEKMQDVRSWIISDSYYLDSEGNRFQDLSQPSSTFITYQPVQKIQFLESPEGIYDYDALLFTTEEAYMKQGLIYGHYFDASSALSELEWEGNAQKAWVQIDGDQPSIKASRLKLRWRSQ